jgi:Kef-type K+ transport system membrane component KefB
MEAFPQWIIILIVVIVIARGAVLLARRFGIPAVTIQLLTGILLGPSLFNISGTPIVLGTWGSPFPGPLHGVLKILAEIGLIQLMFLAGLGVDWQELKKILKHSSSVGAWGFVLTAVSVAIITRVFVDRWSEALAMSAIMSASSFGISVYYFSEAKILGSQVALTVLGAAILSGLLAILLMIASQATNYAVTYGVFKISIAVSWFLAKLIMFFAIAYFLASRFLKFAGKKGFQDRPRQMLIGYLLLVASLYALGALHFGSFAAVSIAATGGALLGISNVEVKNKIAEGFQSVLASILIGVLFVVIGMEVSFKVVGTSVIFPVALLGTAVVTKLIGSWIATRKGMGSSRERVLVMLGALYQGEIGVLIATYLFSRGLLIPSSFNVSIIVVIILTILTPIAMKVAQTKFNIQLSVAPSFTGGEKRDRLLTKN